MALPNRDWIQDAEAAMALLPPEVRAALAHGGAVNREERRGPQALLLDNVVPMGSDQQWHGDNKLVQAKPMPNLQGKWSDGEMVFRFPEAAAAEQLYAFALIHLLPGQVELVLVPEDAQYTVHVMPAVQRDRPDVVRALMGLSSEILAAAQG
jgi:hypothetical protein